MIERVRKEMERLGLNARELSTRAKLGQSFVYDLLSGKSVNPTARKLSALAEALGVSLPYLVSGTSNDNSTYGKDENYIAVPFLMPVEPFGDKLYKPYIFHKKWLLEVVGSKPEELKVVRITDNYMYPTLMKDDIILVDISYKIPTQPGIFLLKSGTSCAARRIEFAPDQNMNIVLISDDSSPRPPHSCSLNEIEVIGRIVWFSRNI